MHLCDFGARLDSCTGPGTTVPGCQGPGGGSHTKKRGMIQVCGVMLKDLHKGP